MAEYLVGKLSQIPPGEGRSFIVGSTELAVFHTRKAGVFATQAACPHRAGPLSDGLTDGAVVICPLHERAFCLQTGEGLGNDCALVTFPVRMTGDSIFVDVPNGS